MIKSFCKKLKLKKQNYAIFISCFYIMTNLKHAKYKYPCKYLNLLRD